MGLVSPWNIFLVRPSIVMHYATKLCTIGLLNVFTTCINRLTCVIQKANRPSNLLVTVASYASAALRDLQQFREKYSVVRNNKHDR